MVCLGYVVLKNNLSYVQDPILQFIYHSMSLYTANRAILLLVWFL
jgi:hypothetical protein